MKEAWLRLKFCRETGHLISVCAVDRKIVVVRFQPLFNLCNETT